MKILAIRGANLASLSSEFEIDLTRGVLGHAGLFAITGNTGAGKSTLLDAICLALYDQMARLTPNRKNQPEIGHAEAAERLKAHDVRHIITRGRAGGFAEVDFIGQDGRTWRARWQVRRARNRTDGRFQKQERSLACLDQAELHAGNKRDVQAQIDEQVGLNWEQFRRAVILPQGDFAAFLKADSNERSALLERMTGTELYSELSIAAYERARDARQQLDQLSRELEACTPLDEAARAALQQELAALETQQAQGRHEQELVSQYQRWQPQQHELQRQHHDAEQAHRQAEADWQENQAARHQLYQIDRAQVARPVFDELARTLVELNELEQQIRVHQQQEQAADAAGQRSRQEAARLQQQSERIESEQRLRQEELNHARELDARVQERQRQWREADERLQTLTVQWQQEQAQYRQLEQAQQQRKQQLDNVSRWLERHQGMAQAAHQWQPLLGALQEAWQDHHQLLNWQQQIQRLQLQLEQVAREQQMTQGVLEPLRLQVATTQQQWQSLGQAFPADQLQSVQQQWMQVRQRGERGQRLMSVIEQGAQWARDGRELALAREGLRQQLEALQQYRQQAEAELATLQTQMMQSAEEMEQAHRRLDLQAHRHLLKDDTPCPLCGALQHPWQGQQPDEENLLLPLQARHQFLVQHVEQRLAAVQDLSVQQAEVKTRLQQLTQQESYLTSQRSELQRFWRQCTEGMETLFPAWPESEAQWMPAMAQLVGDLQLIDRESHELGIQVEQLRQRQGQLQQLRQRFDQQQHQLQQLEQQWHEGLRQQTEWQTRLGGLSQQFDHLHTRLQLNRQRLDEQLGDPSWQLWLEDPHGEQQMLQWKQTCEAFLQQEATWQQLDQRYRQAEPELAALVARLQQGQQQLQQLNSEVQALHQALNGLQHQRAACLEGRAVAEVELAWQQALEQAKQAHARALQQQQKDAEQLVAVRAALESARQRQRQISDQRRVALRSWIQHEQQLGIPEYELHRLLGYPSEWLREERQRLQGLDEVRTRTLALLRERQQMVEQSIRQGERLQQQLPPAACIDGVLQESWLAALAQRLAEAGQREFELRHQLRQASELDSRQQQLQATWAAQQAESRRWEQLNELIGSANGARFRSFAQSLTLERLLWVANEHLTSLAPRYRLLRVPGSDLAMQVMDQDMGDEIRAVESLSGGESFLVSLALALGLASLSGRHARVDSLFIDEGFGTLDPDSLDTAIACLDALQASGRQIGVISHVPAMVERIGVQVRIEARGGGESRVIVP